MKTAYAPDNTRSSIVVVLSLALATSLVAVLIGLSEKPDVPVIGLAAGPSTAVLSAADDVAGADDFGFGLLEGAADESNTASLDATEAPAQAEALTETEPGAATGDASGPDDQAAAAIVVPTAEPTPTPEVAAAVQPTAVADDESDAPSEAAVALSAAPGLPTTSGSVEGAFFTRPDEDEGAVVTQNLIDVSFAEDGSGAFQGVLDITYLDGTHILLNMSGPLVWTATTPQVKATLAGAYTFDAPIDADDFTSDDAELSITSLESGSGSLCTPKCFGFTFPPQNGL